MVGGICRTYAEHNPLLSPQVDRGEFPLLAATCATPQETEPLVTWNGTLARDYVASIGTCKSPFPDPLTGLIRLADRGQRPEPCQSCDAGKEMDLRSSQSGPSLVAQLKP